MTVSLPFLADGVEGGDVVTVLVKPGDTVSEGQALLELETDKATVPVPAPAAGKIEKLLVHDGEHVSVGAPIAEIASDVRAALPPRPTDATVGSERRTANGEPRTAAAAPPAPLPPTPQPPPWAEHQHQQDVRRHDREDTARRAEATPPPPEAQAIEEPAPRQAQGERGGALVRPAADDRRPASDVAAAPSVRRLARELGVDLATVKGSESGGRVSAEDVKAHVRSQGVAAGAPLSQSRVAAGAPLSQSRVAARAPLSQGQDQSEPLTSLRKTIAANVAEAWRTIPHVHQFVDADVTELVALQKRLAPKFKTQGVTLTLTALILKAVAGLLPRHPNFNASLDAAAGQIVRHGGVHLGVAVDTPAGLIVPVVRDADRKDILTLARELADLAERTRRREVKLDELRGATFTISNLGGVGGGAFTPIIHAPEAAILGVGKSRVAPVWAERGFEPRTVLPLCVAYDHRIIDGADGARFAEALKNTLETYEDALFGL